MREARIHVRHVRDILKSLEMADAYNGVDCNSLSFLNVVTQGNEFNITFICPSFIYLNCCIFKNRKEKNSV